MTTHTNDNAITHHLSEGWPVNVLAEDLAAAMDRPSTVEIRTRHGAWRCVVALYATHASDDDETGTVTDAGTFKLSESGRIAHGSRFTIVPLAAVREWRETP